MDLRRGYFVLALVLGGLGLPSPGRSQASAPGPEMSPAEAEAYQMGLELTFACNPQRHRSMPESESMIERADGPLAGTAAFLRTPEGTFLVLEGYDENQAGHCLVLAWFGGELDLGRYPIGQLSYATLEAELDAESHSFFTFSAVRAPDESATLVTEAGSLEIVSMEAGVITGDFALSGFTISSQTRVDDVALEGTFRALER